MKQIAIFAAVSIGLSSFTVSAFAEGKFLKRPKAKAPECFCTDRLGKRRELGDLSCLTVDGRSYQAKCIMAQNNPFWRDQNRGCLSSALPENLTPFPAENPTQVATLYQ